MVKGWKTVGTIVLVVVIIGAILVGVGYLTGADTERIFSVVDDHYLVKATYAWIMNIFSQVV